MTRRRGRTVWGAVVAGAAVTVSACVLEPRPAPPRSAPAPRATQSPAFERPQQRPTPVQPNAPISVPGVLLASGFEQPVCGFWWRPRPGCEFGVEGEAETGPFSPRSGDNALRLQRLNNRTHMGVIADVPLPRGHGFVGVAHRIPAIDGPAFPRGPDYMSSFIQIMQLSPTDGSLPGLPVEVRFYDDRRLGLGVFTSMEAQLSEWRAPVDEWFYLVVEVANGDPATQRMWIFDSEDRHVETVSLTATTMVAWGHQRRTAHKIGGNRSTLRRMYTYHDDWYVSTRFLGPVYVENGRLVGIEKKP